MKYIGTTGTVKIRNVSYVCIYEGKGRKIQNMYGYKCSGSYLLLFSNFAKHFTFTTHVCQEANTSCDAAEMVSDVTYVSSCGKRPYKRFDCFCKAWKPHKTRNIYELWNERKKPLGPNSVYVNGNVNFDLLERLIHFARYRRCNNWDQVTWDIWGHFHIHWVVQTHARIEVDRSN